MKKLTSRLLITILILSILCVPVSAAELVPGGQILGISLEELMDAELTRKPGGEKAEQVLDVALKAIPMAMGIAVTVLAILGELDMQSGFSMLGIGLACLAVREMKQ